MQLFQKTILNSIKQDESTVATRWAEYQKYLAKVEYIEDVKEEKYQEGFLHDIFELCLGYTLDTTNPKAFNLEREKKNETDGKKADGVISIDGKIVAVIELKAQDTKNLDKVEDQAFGYLVSHSYARFVIISNFNELRFYIDKKTAYEKFNLFSLDYESFKKLHLILSFESIKSDIPLQLKEKTTNFEHEISKKLYSDYSTFRISIFENLIVKNPNQDKSLLLRLTQKFCDRVIFILFAEDRGLLAPNTINEIRSRHQNDGFGDRSMYDYYKLYFDAINTGNQRLNIPKYNGGLFAKDEILDSLVLDDTMLDLQAQKLSDYDFASEIGVNILGHIFEQSLTDLEELNASINDTNFDVKKSKRKKDGVFYTPEYITRYIVENTLGKLCKDKREELNIERDTLSSPKNPKKLTKSEETTKTNLETYKKWLFNLKILDPACGSGAFLNQALEFLIVEHKNLQDDLAKMGDLFASYAVEESVLENNLYGVDINEDAVEIARLSLWIRTAVKGRELTKLVDKIKCANSLLDMPFEEGSFDVVIGNPPYVRHEMIKEFKPALKDRYKTFVGTADLYVYFYELGITMLKSNGIMGYICSNKYYTVKYGEPLREYLLNNTTIEVFTDFGDKKVFEDATVTSDINIFKKKSSTDQSSFQIVNANFIHSFDMLQSDLSKSSFAFLPPQKLKLKKKIESMGVSLKEWDVNINFGVKSGFNEAFIIDGIKRKELIDKDKKSDELLKPLLRGKDIQRYYPQYDDVWLIATLPAMNLNINDYPAIKEHLESYGKKLEQSGEKGSRKKTNNKWFETQDAIAFYKEFDNELLIWKRIGSILRFSLGTYYCLDSTCILSSDYNKYLLCVLNSKMGHYMMQGSPRTGTGDLIISVQAIEPLNIPKIQNQEPFIQKADLMLKLNKNLQETIQNFTNELELEKIPKKLQNFEELDFDSFIKEYKKAKKLKCADKLEERNFKNEWRALFENDSKIVVDLKSQINITDREIDRMVYALYGLTEDEILIVEGE